jgi:uncharacterized protein YndB with AHSA1/START domain
MAKTQITAKPGLPQVVMTREFNAPRELIFRAHNDPELLAQWLGPRNMAMTVELYEARDGGRWHFTHKDPDGNKFGFRGVFHGDPSVDGIVRTFEFEGAPGNVSLETATFEDRGGKTLLTMNAVYQTVEARDAMIESGMEDGVNQSMERLDELIARLAPVR